MLLETKMLGVLNWKIKSICEHRLLLIEIEYYTVGLIYDQKKPAYICYGVPGKYSKEPPKELKGYCSYLPLSLFDLGGDGYWMMYQNADSGECVHIDLI